MNLNFPLLVSIAAVLASCKSEDREENGNAAAGDPIIMATHTASERPPNVSSAGIRFTDAVLPYFSDMTGDGGSHFWIYSVAKDGNCHRALLFVRSESRNGCTYKVYIDTHLGDTVRRVRISAEEAEHELQVIEHVLTACGKKRMYDDAYCDRKIESAATGTSPGTGDSIESSAPTVIDDEMNRKIIEDFNHAVVVSIATKARSFRDTQKRANEPEKMNLRANQ